MSQPKSAPKEARQDQEESFKQQKFRLPPSITEKNAWDWLNLIFTPLLIALIAGYFTLSTGQHRIQAEQNRNQQALLIQYSDTISELVEKEILNTNDDDKSNTQRTIASARTLSVLRALDNERQGELLQFLSTAQLINRDRAIISLEGANLGHAYFEYADFERADLRGVNLEHADFKHANLEHADLRDANLEHAYFDYANLEHADLERASLLSANLFFANLKNANLKDVNLESASLLAADLKDANLKNANLGKTFIVGTMNLNPTEIKSACNWQKEVFTSEFSKQLAQEPDQKVNCSGWSDK